MLYQMQEDTGITPKALLDRPSLPQRWAYSYNVFQCLRGSRRYTSAGAANIPISEYNIYAVGYGISGQQWQDVWEDLSTIDNVWLYEIVKKNKQSSEKGT